jgi:hypothetical protein
MESFESVDRSERSFHGPRKLLLCGFPVTAQSKFKTLLDMVGIEDLPLIWCSKQDAPETVGHLMLRSGGSGQGGESTLPRAIIAGGLKEIELHQLMSGCRKSGMRQCLWAVLTPFSEGWPLSRLLEELAAEREALARNSKTPEASE